MIGKADSFTTQELKTFKAKVGNLFSNCLQAFFTTFRSFYQVCFTTSKFSDHLQVFGRLDQEGILTYDFPPTELEQEVDGAYLVG